MKSEQITQPVETANFYLSKLSQLAAELPAQQKATLDEALKGLTVVLSESNSNNRASALLEPITATLGEERYQQLRALGTDYVYTVTIKADHPGNTIHGPGCVAVTGYTAAEYASDPYLWLRMVHKDDRKAVLEQAARVKSGKEAYPVEHRIIHKNGSIRWVRNAPVPRYDEQGRLIAYDGLITDLTEHKASETALRENEERYRALFEASRDAIFLETLEGRILDCNTSACNLYGYTKAEFINLNVANLVPGEVWQILPEVLKAEMASGGMMLESSNLRKDGESFPCEVSTRLMTIGGEQRVIAYVRDITERKLAETARLRQLGAETRAAVAEAAKMALEREVVERKRAESVLQQRARQLTLINEIGGRIVAVLDLDGLLNRAAELIQRSFDYHHVALFSIDSEHNELIMKAKSGSFARIYPVNHRLKMDQGIVGWVATHGEKLLANNVQIEPKYINLYPDVIRTLSELSVPIRVGAELVGVLDVQSLLLNAFDEGDVLVMETLADQIAVAIENARLYKAMERELTERRQAEAALQESEKRYRTLVDTDPDAIIYINLEKKVILSNQRGAELFGVEHPSQMIGMSALQLFTPEDHSWIKEDLSKFPKGWGVRGQEFTLNKIDGTRFPAEVGASLVLGETGEPIGVIGVVRDITQRKLLEQYLARSERLTAMGKISAELAHEIKNPLQSIQSNVELVLDFALDPNERQEHLSLCYRELERLIGLTNRLLSLASPNKIIYETVSVSDLIQRTLVLVDKSLKNIGVKVTSDIPENLPLIRVVPDQIVEVLLNLSINAIEAMPYGGQLSIKAEMDQDWVQLAVINDGRLIPPEDLESIFEPFFTTKPGGTGLGLPISYQIIQDLGGALTVENLHEPDRVRFTIKLPISGFENKLEHSI